MDGTVEYAMFHPLMTVSNDSMHHIWSNVMKTILKLWMSTDYKTADFHITKKEWRRIDALLQKQQIPSTYSRDVRSIIDHLMYLKCSEMRVITLYLLSDILDICVEAKRRPYIQHFKELISLCKVWFSDCIPRSDLDSLDKRAKVWVDDYQTLYGIGAVTMNIHMILHICLMVRILFISTYY
jgi:hypothetical protein